MGKGSIKRDTGFMYSVLWWTSDHAIIPLDDDATRSNAHLYVAFEDATNVEFHPASTYTIEVGLLRSTSHLLRTPAEKLVDGIHTLILPITHPNSTNDHLLQRAHCDPN